MNHLVKLLIALGLAAFVSACATPNKMGLTKEANKIDTSQKSLLLMTVYLNHATQRAVTPRPRIVHVEVPGGDIEDFAVDDDAASIGPDGADYLIRMQLPEGKYTLRAITGLGGVAIFPGSFLLPLASKFDVKPSSVTYLGRIEARTRERQGNEFRAGSLVPLIDQAVTGWSGATWDVVIRDAYEPDIRRFRQTFPALNGVNIDKALLEFDRAKAQAYWEKL